MFGPAWSRLKEFEMTYHADIKKEGTLYESLTPDNLCFECGKAIENAVVRYDGYAYERTIKTISMHPSCAATLGQRLITDGFPNRRND